MKPLKILVPIDFSRHSLETLRYALCLREYCDPTFVLQHVVPDGGVEAFAEFGDDSGVLLARRQEEASQELGREAQKCRDEVPGLSIDTRIMVGIPFKEICRLADEEQFGLIVIGTHGRTGLSHLLIGSTAERVVQHASCPVLSVKPRVL